MADDTPRPARRPGRPATGVTPKRNIRIGTVWDQAATIAEQRGESMTQVVEAELRRYVARHRSLLAAVQAMSDPQLHPEKYAP